MANIEVNDTEAVGRILIKASQDPEALAALQADPAKAFGGAVTIPEGHKLVVHVNTDEETHLMIPDQGLVRTMLDLIGNGGSYNYPKGYIPGSDGYVSPAKDNRRAYDFRVGDYALAQCG